MARHVQNRPGDHTPKDVPTIPGGAGGMTVAATAGDSGGVPGVAAVFAKAQHQPRRFEVVGAKRTNPDGSYPVVYNGGVSRVNRGKVYPEGSCDLDVLRAQGIELREILPDPPAVTTDLPEAAAEA
jgi:hypothetical protein